jgi:hypothetical protein
VVCHACFAGGHASPTIVSGFATSAPLLGAAAGSDELQPTRYGIMTTIQH